MSAGRSNWCLTFCLPDKEWSGKYQIQWQFPHFTVTSTSHDLTFARQILDFVADTRNKPQYRDTPLGAGVYRYMDEKSVDVSASFEQVQIKLEKWGESDHGYLLRIDCADRLSLVVDLRDQEVIDAFVDGMKDIVDDYLDE